MNTDIDQRESRVIDFINAKNQQITRDEDEKSIQSSPEVKLRKLNNEVCKGKSICIDAILGRLYKDALPFNDPKKNCSDADAQNVIHDYIAHRTDGNNSEYYVREGLKRTNSSLLKSILTEAENITKSFYKEKAKDIGVISIKDLNFNPNLNTEDLNKITKKLELDDISDIIRDNVQKTIKDEVDKTKREDEYNQKLEDKLATDTSVVDEPSMESAIQKITMASRPTVYQPSLFEAIMIGNEKSSNTSQGEAFSESVHEFTKLNITKALCLESFNINTIKKMANNYLK